LINIYGVLAALLQVLYQTTGIYWLQVKDDKNCIGKDTIIVNPKDCGKGFFVPTAFTPNNDGKNDLLKPILLGNVKQYHFWIYNRWGELIFETNDLDKRMEWHVQRTTSE
jgi:hypothetical protein